MAEIFPDEGLDFILDVMPRRRRTAPETLYVGLFVSQSPTTVPARSAQLATQTGVTEITGPGYGRAAVAASLWGDSMTVGEGRRTALPDPGISFAQSQGGWTGPANGFFVATALTGGFALFYSNFDQLEAIPILAAGYTVRVPAFWQANG